jgi:uncharacterized membrane protein YcaP (DUF421 family)
MDTVNDLLGLNVSELAWYHMLVRAIVVYLVSLVFIRLAGMRSFGTSSTFDVVVTICMGAILGRSILGGVSFVGCLVAALTVALMHRLIAFLNFQSMAIRKLVEGQPVLLFKDGEKIDANLRRHSIHDEDIKRSMREENIGDLNTVKSIWYEADGKISVVKKESQKESQQSHNKQNQIKKQKLNPL